jgi:ATP-dependent DNA helicase RecQ
MSEIYNAGFYLHYLWEMRERLSEVAQFDLSRTLRTLSTFHLTRHQPPGAPPKVPSTEIDQHILAVYGTLLQRGLPTLAPLAVERALCASVTPVIPVAEKIDGSGTFRFAHGTMNRQREVDWLESLVRAHLPVDPRLSPDARSVEAFDSDEERYFYGAVLPAAIGPAAALLVEPQRLIESVLPPKKAPGFLDQRLDFTLDAGNSRVVFEVDGPEHRLPAQKALDNSRDDALLEEGWRTYRTPVYEIAAVRTVDNLKKGVTDPALLKRLAGLSAEPLWGSDMGIAALQLVLAPFAVARIQRALLLALEEGRLHLDQGIWRLTIVERDVRAGKLAVVDFLQHLNAFYRLWGIVRSLPKISLRIIGTREFASAIPEVIGTTAGLPDIDVSTFSLTNPPADYFDGHLLLDVAMLQPPGFTGLDAALINWHLTTAGVAYEIRSQLHSSDVRRISKCRPRPYPASRINPHTLRFFLQNIFRKQEFRNGQVGILERSLALKPVIGLLPTGAGKSLCYQLSILLQPGLSLGVVPLISLMVDQVDNLCNKLAIDWIGYINSQLEADEKAQVQQRMADGELLLLLMSPERLQSKEFRVQLKAVAQTYSVTYAVIDEAHCVSEWGHDFRTSYLKLAPTIRDYAGSNGYSPTTIALTGTASFAVLSDVQREIGVDDENAKVYPKSFDRQELRFGVVQVDSLEKAKALKQLLDTLPAEYGLDPNGFYTPTGDDETTHAGIVFVPHTNGQYGVFDVSNSITKHIGVHVELFSGQQPNLWAGQSYDDYKLKTQHDFKKNAFPLLVATKAFGMGVDKPNVRFTIHYNISQSLEGFYQEAGRAGRDRRQSHCWVIFSDDNPEEADQAFAPDVTPEQIKQIADGYDTGDVQRLLYLQQRSYPGVEREFEVIERVYKTCLWPKLMDKAVGEAVQVAVGFDKEEDARDKALYRLSLVGPVQDYTKDYNKKQYDVTAVLLEDTGYVANLQAYIRRYKTREVADLVAAEVNDLPGNTMLAKCVRYLLKFVYQEIERKRRIAIRSMAEVARRAAARPDEADAIVRAELLAYLEESPFTKPLEKIVRQLDPGAWMSVLTLKDETGAPLLRSVDGARQLLGGCRRLLESYPDDAGLLFLTSLARLLLPEADIDQAIEEARQSFAALRLRPQGQLTTDLRRLLAAYRQWLRNTQDFRDVFARLAEAALDTDPTRDLARHLYPDAPHKSRTLLLNFTLADVHSLADRLCV